MRAGHEQNAHEPAVLHDSADIKGGTRNELAGELSKRAGREISEKEPASFFIVPAPPFHYGVIPFVTVVSPRTARIRIKERRRATAAKTIRANSGVFALFCGHIAVESSSVLP